MDYVIFDLEWNNSYDYRSKRGVNEIIEIGAVRLGRNFEVKDTFKQLIMPRLSKKLTKRFVNLTGITPEEINETGILFDDAMSDFVRWASGDVLFMSWSNSDLYVLLSNYKMFLKKDTVSFIKKYMDAQKYCQSRLNLPTNDQISLAHCAEVLDISLEGLCLHRALEDCYLAAECFKAVYDKDAVGKYICECGEDFFLRLAFKPYLIKTPVSENYNYYEESFSCPICGKNMKRLSNPQVLSGSFKTVFGCDDCNKKFWTFTRAKQTYDCIKVTKRIVEMNKKRARKY